MVFTVPDGEAPLNFFIPVLYHDAYFFFHLVFSFVHRLVRTQDMRRKDPTVVDEEIAKRIKGELQFYDGTTHLGLFGAPKWLRAQIESEERIMTEENPVFMY